MLNLTKISNLIISVKRLLRRAEVDRAVIFGLLTKIWSVVIGFLTLLLIANKFTPQLQGYYYTFSNLIGLQVFIELGLSAVIIPFASHEWSKLVLDKSGHIAGDSQALSRLVSLARFTVTWYLVGSLIVIFGLGVGGYIFFSQTQGYHIRWILPWLSLCLFTGITLCLTPILSLLEGCNQVLNVYAFRFFAGLFSGLAICVAIIMGAKLWTQVIVSIVNLVCTIIFLRILYWKFLRALLFSNPQSSVIKWHSDILPMQWRIALSWISGYFVFSFFTPVLFKYHGPVIAGQMGMTWTFIGVLGLVSSSWLYPKVPRFGMLIARKDYKELDRLFWRITKIVTAITIMTAALIWLLVYIVNKLHHPIAERFLSPLPTACLLLAQVLIAISLPFSSYLRAHKKEPLLFLSVLSGILTAISTLVLGKYFSATGMAIGFLLLNLILIPFVGIIWYRCKVSWHNLANA